MGLCKEYLRRPNNMENVWIIYMRNIYVGFIQEKLVGAQYHGEYLNNVQEIFMWAQNNVWAHVGIFCEWANEIKARKFVPQHSQYAMVTFKVSIFFFF